MSELVAFAHKSKVVRAVSDAHLLRGTYSVVISSLPFFFWVIYGAYGERRYGLSGSLAFFFVP